MRYPEDKIPDEPVSERVLTVLLILAAGGFALMLVWLVGR